MVSLDDPERNRAFAESVGASFVLLSDPSKQAAEAYGVLAMGGLYARRVTFYIGADGQILRVDDDVDTETHGQDVIQTLEELGFARKAGGPRTPDSPSSSSGP
jgi:peroxiredoxin Q/BCP